MGYIVSLNHIWFGVSKFDDDKKNKSVKLLISDDSCDAARDLLTQSGDDSYLTVKFTPSTKFVDGTFEDVARHTELMVIVEPRPYNFMGKSGIWLEVVKCKILGKRELPVKDYQFEYKNYPISQSLFLSVLSLSL